MAVSLIFLLYSSFIRPYFCKEPRYKLIAADGYKLDAELIPVEIKATNRQAKSLRTLIGSEKYSDISHRSKLTRGISGTATIVARSHTFARFC